MARHNAGAHARRATVPSKAAFVISMLIVVGVLIAAALVAIFAA